MKRVLSTEDMQIAQLVASGQSEAKIGAKLGISSKTVQRRKARPEIIELVATIKAQRQAVLNGPIIEKLAKSEEQGTSAGEIVVEFNFWIAAQRYQEMYFNSKNEFCKLKALEGMVTLFGVAKGVVPTQADAPEKPKFYRSEWMDEKPN